jgi:hypothetical protein
MIKIRLIAAAFALTVPAAAMAASPVQIHRDPGCACCGEWPARVKAQFGRTLRVIDGPKRTALQKARGVPANLASCHTAVIDGMTFEGHVPIPDMKRALVTRPKGITGLAVAGIPAGSPGMEMPSMNDQAYEVVAFGPGVRRLFARHGG